MLQVLWKGCADMIRKSSKTMTWGLILVIALLLSYLPVSAVFAVSHTTVTVDGRVLQFDVPPTIIDGRTLVPLRAIFEALGAEVEWDGATRTVTGRKDATTIILPIGSRSPTVNGMPVQLDVAGTIIDGRTLVPARFIAESLGAAVDWVADTRTVVIFSAGAVDTPQEVVAPPEEPGYIGVRFSGNNVPGDLISLGGWMFGAHGVYNETYSYTSVQHRQSGEDMIWLTEITHRDAQGVPAYVVSDVVVIPVFSDNQAIAVDLLRGDGSVIIGGFAVVEWEDAEYFSQIYKAWRFDENSKKIMEIPVQGITAVNDAYGL